MTKANHSELVLLQLSTAYEDGVLEMLELIIYLVRICNFYNKTYMVLWLVSAYPQITIWTCHYRNIKYYFKISVSVVGTLVE